VLAGHRRLPGFVFSAEAKTKPFGGFTKRNSHDRVPFIPANENMGDWGKRKKKAGMANGSVEPKTKLARPTC
jgi:hypothetical protein